MQDTIVIIKPDAFWRSLNGQIEARIAGLGLRLAGEAALAGGDNLSEGKWRDFYFPSIGHIPICLEATAKYMAFGPVKVMHLAGVDAISAVRKAIGATRPWLAEPGTIRRDFWMGATEANAEYSRKFQKPGDDVLLFNLVHASDSDASFAREFSFFDNRLDVNNSVDKL